MIQKQYAFPHLIKKKKKAHSQAKLSQDSLEARSKKLEAILSSAAYEVT